MAVDLTMGVDASGGRDGCAVGPIWMAGKTKEWHGERCRLGYGRKPLWCNGSKQGGLGFL